MLELPSSAGIVRVALDQMHSLGLVPRSRYTTSWDGLTFKQAIRMPLPPYLSPIPVIFRMLAYAVIAPFVLLLFLDIGGYIVWRIYEGVSLTGTRTAFYKFRTSPVFVRSRAGSPVISKGSSSNSNSNGPSLAPSPPRTPGTRETSISPISSSASLQDDGFDGLNSDGELVNSSSSSSSPPDFSEVLPDGGTSFNASTSISHLDTANLDASIRRRAIHRHSAGSGKRFSMGSDEDDDGQNEREQTPTLTSMTSGPPHLTRSNSLGLGFSDREDPIPTVGGAESNASQPAMYIASSTNAPVVSSKSVPSSDDLVKIEESPAGSIGSSALEEDDRIFDEAKEAL